MNFWNFFLIIIIHIYMHNSSPIFQFWTWTTTTTATKQFLRPWLLRRSWSKRKERKIYWQCRGINNEGDNLGDNPLFLLLWYFIAHLKIRCSFLRESLNETYKHIFHCTHYEISKYRLIDQKDLKTNIWFRHTG